MAFQYNHYYEIYNGGKYVNLNGDHENNVVNNGEKVTMYARTNNPDQRWALERYGSDYQVRILLTQDRSVAQTPHRGVCCLCKRELVGAQPLHLAIARPFCHLKAPPGLSLLHFVSQTRIFQHLTTHLTKCRRTDFKNHPAGCRGRKTARSGQDRFLQTQSCRFLLYLKKLFCLSIDKLDNRTRNDNCNDCAYTKLSAKQNTYYHNQNI